MQVFHADTVPHIQAAIAAAIDENSPLEIRAGGSKHALGRPTTAHRLNISGLSGIVDYDPDELILIVRPATTLTEITSLLATRRQMLAFEPPAWHTLFTTNAAPTIGGTVAANLAGPRRIRAGSVRDHLLGFAAVNGRAEPWRGGGRVVKNVSGYDMSKLHCGAFGTLSVLTELCLRVVPAPPTTATLLIGAETPEAASKIFAQSLNFPQEVSAAAALPAAIAARAGLTPSAPLTVLLRLEGPAQSVADRAATLRRHFHVTGELGADVSAATWHAIAAVSPLLPDPSAIIWRLCPEPAHAPALLAALGPLAEHAYLDWGGGLIWIALPTPGPDAGAATIRAALGAHGHATLIRAPNPLRASVPVFQPLAPPLAALTARIRAAFDPALILNRGRLLPEA